MARRPDLSVVIVVLSGPRALDGCLSALTGQVGVPRPEIVVPHDEELTGTRALRNRYPDVRFVAASGRRSYAELRSLGCRSASGRVVAVTEDHCTPDPDWCERLLAHHASGHDVVGGRVERAESNGAGPSSALDWAVYVTDFHRYMGPVEPGASSYLTDCNVSYSREALESAATLWEEEFHETTVNWALEEAGRSLHLADDVVVRQHRHLPLAYALSERFAFGRLFASTRVRRLGLPGRMLYAGASALLPGLLTARVLAVVSRKGRHVGRTLRSLPHLVLINTIWAAGEFVGYVTGRSDDLPIPPGFGGSDDPWSEEGAGVAGDPA